MTAGKAKSFEGQLDSYRDISRRRTRAADQADYGPGWMRFAAAAGASLAGAATADAAINHVVPPSPIRVEVYYGDSTSINLDGGLDIDLSLRAVYTDASPTYYGYRYAGLAYGINNAKLIGDGPIGPFDSIAVHKFTAGQVIPAVEPAAEGYMLQVSATSSSNPATYAGQWGISGTGFAGFVNGPVGSRRAGWIKIRMEPTDFERLGAIEVLEWAYQTVAGVSIMAGQTTLTTILGDYNNNGSVGPEDYSLWKSTFGNAVAAGSGADGNSNSKVDIGDYTVWRNNFGEMGGSLVGAVPEPSTIALSVLALGAAGIAALRRRSK